MSRSSLGKPLKGSNIISQRGGTLDVDYINAGDIQIGDTNISDIIGGDFIFDPIDINSGTIDGVVIGADEPGPSFFTSLQTGDVSGTGFDVFFYSTTVGDFVRWNANNSTFFIEGNLNVRDETNLGDMNFDGNTISTNVTNQDLILDPNGTGCVVINSCIVQNSTSGNVEFNVINGDFESTASNLVKLQSLDNSIFLESHSNTEISTHNGNIEMVTERGASLCITTISSGAGSVQITTSTHHDLVAGATVTIVNSNSSPTIDGIYSIVSIVDDFNFTISTSVTTPGTSGYIKINVDVANISIGNPLITITTVNDHNLNIGDTITLANTNSTPTIDGVKTVNSIISSTQFDITGLTTGTGSTGTVTKTLNNFLELHSNFIKMSGNIDINNNRCHETLQRNLKIYNTEVFFDDNLLVIGGVDSKTTDENKDKGFLFNWYNGTSKQGFFGFDESTECFTFIPDATITNDVVSGSPGCLNIGDITATQLDLQNGDLLNVNEVTVSQLNGNPDLTLTATNDIFLNATNNVNIPTEVGLTFGGDSNFIEYNSAAGGFCIESSTNIKLTPVDDVIIPSNVGIVLDGNTSGTSTQTIESNGTDITIETTDLNLNATEDINIPLNVGLTFGGDSQSIEYDGDSLNVDVDGDIHLTPTTGNDVTIPCDIGLVFTGENPNIDHRIESNCTDLTITSSKTTGTSDINLSAKTNINVPTNVGLTFSNDNHNIKSTGTNLSVSSSGDIDLTATNDVNIPLDVGLTLGNDNTKIENNGTDITVVTDKNLLTTATGDISSTSTTGDISLISSTGDIYLIPSLTTKSIIIPQEVDVQFGSTTTNITSDTSNNLILNTTTDVNIVAGDDINLTASDKIRIPSNVELELGTTSEYIVGTGSNVDLFSSNNFNVNAVLTTISGNLQVNGTTTTINSTTVTIDDPIFTLGGDIAPVLDDNKDRGIEFKWHNGTSAKTGFFGFDDSTGCFTFIPDGTNTSEVFSGAAGCINVGDITATNLDLQNGDITNANIINLNNLHGDPDLTLTATNDIFLTATNDVNIPDDVGLTFGDDSNIIEYNSTTDVLNITTDSTLQTTSNNTIIQSNTDISLNATSSVNIPTNTQMEFGGTSNYIVSDGTDLCFVTPNDIKFDAANILLNATNSIDVPTNIPINLNDSETSYLIGNTSGDVTLVAEDNIHLNPGTGFDIHIPVNTGFVFESSGTANKIEYNGTDLCIDSSGDIKLTPAGGDVNITGNITNAVWQGGVIGTTYGGTGKSSWTQGSVIFAGSGGTSLEEDNANLYWIDSTNRLAIGSNSGIDHSLTVANSGNLSFRNSFNNDKPGILFQNSNRSYTWNIYRSEGSGSNSNFHIAGGINEAAYPDLAQRLVIEETGTVGINFPTVNATIASNTSANPTIITTTLAHDLESGNIVTISGSDAVPDINGSHTITVLSPTTFSIPIDTTTGFTVASTGNVNIIDADRVDNSGTIKLHVNGCIKLASEGIGSSCLLFGNNGIIEVNNSGDLVITSNQDIDFNLPTTNNINIPTNVGLTFGTDGDIIEYDGTDLCIKSSGDLCLEPAGGDVTIIGNLFVTGSTNISGGGGGGSGTVDDFIVCLGKGQDLAISSIVSSGANTVDVTTTTHNLVNGDVITITDTDSTPVIDGNYTVSVVSSSIVQITFTGSITVSGTTGNLRSKHVTDPAKDVGICFDWHDGVTTGTANANNGFFGFDRSSERFKYIPDATITSSVVSGTLGDLEFNKAYLTNAEVSTLTDTEVVFASTNGLLVSDSGMTYNSTTNTLSVDQVVANNLISDTDFDANTILKADTDDNPVLLTVPEETLVGRLSGGVITALTAAQVNNFLGTTSSSFERISPIVTSSISSIGLGTPSTITTSSSHGLTTSDTVTISGSDSTPSIDGNYTVTVTGTNTFTIPSPNVTIVGTTGTVTGAIVNPDTNKLVTFVNVLGESSIASGTLSASTDGAFKHIIMSSIPTGSSYELTLTLLDPGTTSVAVKKLVFTCAGQSSHLIYDDVLGSWIIVNSGAFVTPI